MQQRHKLVAHQLGTFNNFIPPQFESGDAFGHEIMEMLFAVCSSILERIECTCVQMHDNVPANGWMYYVMATQYWRLAGNAPNAVACARMALHYVDE